MAQVYEYTDEFEQEVFEYLAEIEQQYLDAGLSIGDINAATEPACNCEAARGAYGHWLSCEHCR